jgi:hypothetical protein
MLLILPFRSHLGRKITSMIKIMSKRKTFAPSV